MSAVLGLCVGSRYPSLGGCEALFGNALQLRVVEMEKYVVTR